MKEFSWITTYSEICDATGGGPLSRPQEGIFSSTTVETICFVRRNWEAWGKESVNQEQGMESCLQLSCVHVST